MGLFLYLVLGTLAWRSCSTISRRARRYDETVWMSDLASMIQASLFAYAVTGAFLGLAFFDLYYTMIAMIVITKLMFADFLVTEETQVDLPDIAPPRLAAKWARAR